MDTIIDRSVDVSDFTEAGGLLFGPGISEGSMGLVQKTAGGIVVKQATACGYIEAVDGDGVSLAFPGSTTRRGRVIHQKSHTEQSTTRRTSRRRSMSTRLTTL